MPAGLRRLHTPAGGRKLARQLGPLLRPALQRPARAAVYEQHVLGVRAAHAGSHRAELVGLQAAPGRLLHRRLPRQNHRLAAQHEAPRDVVPALVAHMPAAARLPVSLALGERKPACNQGEGTMRGTVALPAAAADSRSGRTLSG